MSESLQYTLLESDIHKFEWLDDDITPDITKDYAEQYTAIYNEMEENQTLRILHIYTKQGTPKFYSVAYAFRNFVKRDDITVRVAYLIDNDQVPRKMESISRYNEFGALRKFFKTEQEHQAIEWLLSAEMM